MRLLCWWILGALIVLSVKNVLVCYQVINPQSNQSKCVLLMVVCYNATESFLVVGGVFRLLFSVLISRFCHWGVMTLFWGMNWLEINSPMTVHWLKKSLSFWTEGRIICLQGIKDSSPQCCLVWSNYEQAVPEHFGSSVYVIEGVDLDIPHIIQTLLVEFVHLFEEPQGLPPRRDFDHSIPLLAWLGH